MASLTGQTVVVTGAGRGIGRAIAVAFATAGAYVACLARTQEEIEDTANLINKDGQGRGLAIQADVTDAKSIQQALFTVTKEYGQVDILINNAGVDRTVKFEHEQSIDTWWHLLEVNLKGPAEMIRSVLPAMLDRRHGTIISIGSRCAHFDHQFSTAYSVSKTALLKLHQCLELEICGRGVYTYVVQPGDVATTIGRQQDREHAGDEEDAPDLLAVRQTLLAKGSHPPELCASACVTLASTKVYQVLSGRYVDLELGLDEVLRLTQEEPPCELWRRPLFSLRVGSM